MSRFKIILPHSKKENMGAAAAAKMEFTHRLIFTGFVLILACFAGFCYISKAWFASNKDVGAENASVTSESGTPNLFIRLQSDHSASFYSLVSKDWSGDASPLFPISTADCANWYYISDWAMVYTQNPDDSSITTGEYYASRYTQASLNDDGTYPGYAGKTHRAYYCGQYNLYSDKGALDVYLNPNDPIVVDIKGDDANKGLKEAIRVAVVGPKTKFIYAPVAESGTGKNYIDNSGTMAVADTFYAVTGANTAVKQDGILFPATDGSGNVTDDGLGAYKGGTVENDPHSFTAGTTAICRADVNGADVSVYVWLEGMDAQSIINTADGRTIDVKLNFVGVPVAETP